MKSFEFECKRVLLGRLEKGDDVLEGLTEFCVQHGVAAGSIQALGLVQRGRLGFYDQAIAARHEIEFEQGMEILQSTSLEDLAHRARNKQGDSATT